MEDIRSIVSYMEECKDLKSKIQTLSDELNKKISKFESILVSAHKVARNEDNTEFSNYMNEYDVLCISITEDIAALRGHYSFFDMDNSDTYEDILSAIIDYQQS